MNPLKRLGKEIRGWLPPIDLAASGPHRMQLGVKAGIAIGIAAILAAMSVFFIFVGVPGSYGTISEQCSLGSPCVQSQQTGISYTQVPAAVVPLFATGSVAIGLIKRSKVLLWVGVMVLLAFSFLSLFSVGLLYLPFAIALVGLTAAIRYHAPAGIEPGTNQ